MITRSVSSLLLSATLLGGSPTTFAQQSDDAVRSSFTDTDNVRTNPDGVLRPMWVADGIDMRSRLPLDLGLSLSYGHDSAVNNIPDASSQIGSAQGHLGIAFPGRRFVGSFSHDSTIMKFPFSNIAFQQYHWTSVSLAGIASHRTSWGLSAANAYGSDSARAGNSLSLSSINNTPADSNIDAGFITGNTLRQYLNFALDHQTSEQSAVSFGANANVNNFLGSAPSTQQYDVNIAARHKWGEHKLIGVRTDGVRQDFGGASCNTGSLSGFTAIEFTRSLRVDGSGGPVFGSSQCTGTYQYEGIFSVKNALGDRLYVGSSRKRGSGIISGSLWETSHYGGLQVGDNRKILIAISGGYTSYHGGTLAVDNADVSGYFASGEIHRRLTHSSEWSFSARHFDRTNASIQLERTVLFLTYSWSWQDGDSYAQR